MGDLVIRSSRENKVRFPLSIIRLLRIAFARRWTFVPIFLVVATTGALGSDTASASEPIESFSAAPSTTQAGAHANLVVEWNNENRFLNSRQTQCNCNDVRDIHVSLPPGFIGNPHATPQCLPVDFAADTCPLDSLVGNVEVRILNPPANITVGVGLYNLAPGPNQAGLLGFKVPLFDAPVVEVLSARTGGDYGLNITTTGVEQVLPISGLRQELWGVPADASHDPERCNPHCGIPSNSPAEPLVSNPTTCDGPLSSSLELVFYDDSVAHAEAPWPETTGCDQLSFNPSLYAQPSTTATDSASGLAVNVSVPQFESPTTPSPSEIRATTVTLPQGFSINPNAADGKTSCADAEALIGPFASEEEAHCPEFSKVGSLTLTSSALPGPLQGGIYIGEPQPGNRYRIFLTANGFATHIKLAGSVEPSPQTGQLEFSLQNLPQTPFSDFNLHFFGSERGLLATPTQCGTYPVTSTFIPWDAALSKQTSTQYFTLDSGPGGAPCPGAVRPFTPGFSAASTGNTAGAHTSFSIDITRSDGDQSLTGLSITSPPGFLATLKGVPYCSGAALVAAMQPSYSGLAEESSPSCPAASQIGIATAGAGAGTHPVYLPGKVYLAGPYKGAPLSLAVITPAVSGPYDLGNVVVRAALHVNPETAQITAVSDPLPQILQGIPLRLRSILIELNRQNFTLNPTNCDPFSVQGQITGDQGAVANLILPFPGRQLRQPPVRPQVRRWALRSHPPHWQSHAHGDRNG